MILKSYWTLMVCTAKTEQFDGRTPLVRCTLQEAVSNRVQTFLHTTSSTASYVLSRDGGAHSCLLQLSSCSNNDNMPLRCPSATRHLFNPSRRIPRQRARWSSTLSQRQGSDRSASQTQIQDVNNNDTTASTSLAQSTANSQPN